MGIKNFIKKSISFVSAAAMALTMVAMPVGASSSYAAEGTEDNLHLSKGIELQPDGNYKITLEAYSTGQDTITTTEEAVPLDIVLVLDQSGSMSKNFGSTTRLSALKNAVTNFVNTVKDDATKNDVNHRISMVGFASTKEETGDWFDRTYTYPNTEILTVTGNSAVNYKTASDNNTTFENALKNSLMNVRTQSSKITQAINMLDADGDTYSEYGMDMASRILEKYPVQEGENRKQIIVMFTDGYTAPSGTNNINYSMSDRAIANAKVAKDNGATVYTIGIFDGANPNMDINNNYQYGSTNSNKQLVAANRYMNLVSSNYPQAENMTTTGTKAAQASYYQSASNATELNNIFESISKSETTSGTTVTLKDDSVLRDIISDKFELPDGAKASAVSVSTADSKSVSSDGQNITWDTEEKDTSNKYKVSINGNKVDVTGFDYSQNFVTASHKGKKLIVEIIVNGLQSGIDMDSNDTETEKSGIYENSSATTAVKNFVSPKVTIPEYSYVLDYGKKVTIPNTDTNLNKTYSETTQMNSTKAAPTTLTSIKKTYGTFALENNAVTYQPGKINWDGFDSIFSFSQKADSKYEWSKTNVIPATSVYYEDDFGTDDNTDANVAIVWKGKWSSGTSNGGQQDSTNSKYGWDSSYVDDKGFSNGSAHVSYENFATATFRFTGTGVDVYSRTNSGVGKISTSLKKVTKNADGTETVKAIKYKSIDNLSVSGDYYQIPTLNYDDLDYGTYEVTIKVITVSAENRGTYYLDGIRVYNPLGKVDANSTAGKAYKEANESNAQYIQVRKYLLDSSTTESIDKQINGVVFIDKSKNNIVGDSTSSVGTYKDYGPKNEVYLKSDTTKNKIQGVAFNINGYNSDNNKVFIGLKSPTGKEVKVKVTSGEKTEEIKLNSAADLYYEIKPTEQGNVVIENMSDNLLSITKVRITSEISTTNGYALTSTPELMSYVNTFDALQEKQDTNKKDTEDTLDKGDVDINNPGDNDTNKDNSSQDNNEQTKPDNTWNKIMNSIKSWFRR